MIKHPFLITGLPRSRTSWLAAFLTTGKSHCYHSGILGCRSFDDYKRKLSGPKLFMGDSFTDTVLFYDDIHRTFPGARWVVVRRDYQEAYLAYRKAFPDLHTALEAQEIFERIHNQFDSIPNDACSVYFEDLNQRGVIKAIWEHCLPDIDWDEQRWKLFNGLKIEPHHDKEVKAILSNQHTLCQLSLPR